MSTTTHRFTIGESLGLILLLLGVPGAMLGFATILQDGQTILGLTRAHWIFWAGGAVASVLMAFASRRFSPLYGLPVILLTLVVAGVRDPMSAGPTPYDQVLETFPAVIGWISAGAPAAFGLAFGLGPVLDRINLHRNRP